MSEVLRLSDKIYPDYIAAGEYHMYLQNKMYNEQRLASMLHSSGIITESGLNNIKAFNEAKLGDKVKSKWNKFIEFIKGLVAKFMESMTNLLLDEKDYLEKYKDIILKRKPREDFEYSYTGNYEMGINRMMNTELPIFNYETHAAALKEDGDAPILSKLNIKDFKYDENETLADQFKAYYLATEQGENKGKFSNLNWTNMYNFCYNYKKIKDMVDKDVKHLDSSTNTIQQALQKELTLQKQNASSVTDDKGSNTVEKSETEVVDNHNDGDTSDESSVKNLTGSYFTEADKDKSDLKTGSGLSISTTNSNATKQMGTYTGDDAKNTDQATADKNVEGMKKAQAENPDAASEQIVDQICQKWIRVCNPIITAKMYACQHIAKDYMEIIRTHVRSYGGKDLKKDKQSTKTADRASDYQKDSARAQNNQAQQGGNDNTAEGENK